MNKAEQDEILLYVILITEVNRLYVRLINAKTPATQKRITGLIKVKQVRIDKLCKVNKMLKQ